MRHTRYSLGFVVAALTASLAVSAQTPLEPLKTTEAVIVDGPAASAFDGVVEAVRQTVIAAQVSGALIQLDVKVGDRVAAGQVLLRIDARLAEQNAAASDAQVQAARSALDLATKDFKRQQQLFQKHYISQTAMERAATAYKSAQAQAKASLAQAEASRTQSGYHIVRAPFAGIVSEVPVSLGDMAMPGRPLLTLYDPTALRVTAAVPQSVAARMATDPQPRIELSGLPAADAWVTPEKIQLLPTADAATHTVQLRAGLPDGAPAVLPGMFVRLWLVLERRDALGTVPEVRLFVPVATIVRRAELTGLYILDAQGKPVLRQVRLGPSIDGHVEVLSGLMPGQQVVIDPQSAARAH